MHSIHLHGAHLPKGSNLFALSIGEVIWFSMALFFFLVSWAVGGEEFKESIGGNIILAGLLSGLVIGFILCRITKPNNLNN
jgi:hypothetical protein